MKARLSWVIYIKIGIIAVLIYLAILMAIPPLFVLNFGIEASGKVVVTALVIMTLLYFGVVFYFLYKVHDCCAYIDRDGIWFRQNIFPWSRGLIGVRWENFDQAQYRPSVISWMTKSYTVFLQDRFGKSVVIKNLYNGRKWSGAVNTVAMRPENE